MHFLSSHRPSPIVCIFYIKECMVHPFLGWITPGICETHFWWTAMPLSLGWGVWPNGTLRLAVCCPSPGIPGALGKGLSCLTFHHICSVCDIRCLARPSTLVVHVPHWRPTRDGVVSTGQFSFPLFSWYFLSFLLLLNLLLSTCFISVVIIMKISFVIV